MMASCASPVTARSRDEIGVRVAAHAVRNDRVCSRGDAHARDGGAGDRRAEEAQSLVARHQRIARVDLDIVRVERAGDVCFASLSFEIGLSPATASDRRELRESTQRGQLISVLDCPVAVTRFEQSGDAGTTLGCTALTIT